MQAFERLFNNLRLLEEKTCRESDWNHREGRGKVNSGSKEIKEESLDLNLSYLCLAV